MLNKSEGIMKMNDTSYESFMYGSTPFLLPTKIPNENDIYNLESRNEYDIYQTALGH